MKIEVSEITENADGGATIVLNGDKEDLDEFQNIMFSHFLTSAIKMIKESEVKIIDDLNDSFAIRINYDDYDKLENKLIQVKSILNVLTEAYSAKEFEDLNGSLWAASEMVQEVIDILDGEQD
jgi:acylphosphatase